MDNKTTPKPKAKKTTSPVKKETAPKKTKSFGVIIAALDSPYYGNYAFQLALSLKHTSPKLNVALLCNDGGVSHLSPDKISFFDKTIKVNKTAVTSNGQPATLKFKTYLYDVSPYDKTLFLDADTLFCPKRSVEQMIAEIPKGCKFTMQNRGAIDLANATEQQLNSRFTIWANSLQIKEAYKFKDGRLFNLSSELIYFEKDEKVKQLFKTAQKEYDNIKVSYELFNGGVPDELPFAISMIKNKMYPHQEIWRPFYWEAFDKKRLLHNPRDLYQQYYGVSFGGNIQESFIKKFYKNLAQYYANQFGVQHIFGLKDKRSFLPNRHTI